LSYCWGTVPSKLRLLYETYEQLKDGVELKMFPNSHQQAFALARSLGIRYLFIDAICIMQDNINDYSIELARFGRYIRLADVVFAATGKTAQEPLVQTEEFSESGGITGVTIQAHLEADEAHSFGLGLRVAIPTAVETLEKEVTVRGWRIQETLLAERLVIFGQEQTYWMCTRMLKSEGSSISLPVKETSLASLLGSYHHPNHLEAAGGLGIARSLSLRSLQKRWNSVVETMSRSHFTVKGDILPALMNVVKAYQELGESGWFSKGYRFGIWLGDLAQGLLWIHDPNMKATSMAKTPTVRVFNEYKEAAPSWSWVSNAAPV
ncbi:hypothetical protein AOQ84DRAFT_265911, partial [Glonium stellatum]